MNKIIKKYTDWFENHTCKNFDTETMLQDFAKEIISNQVQAGVVPMACGQQLLKAMMELKYNPDKDMMPTVKRIETSNGGMTTYLRHDAVVKYCNENFISKPLA